MPRNRKLHAEMAAGALADARLSFSGVDGHFCAGDAPGMGAVELMVRKTAWKLDAGGDEANTAKWLAADAAFQAADPVPVAPQSYRESTCSGVLVPY